MNIGVLFHTCKRSWKRCKTDEIFVFSPSSRSSFLIESRRRECLSSMKLSSCSSIIGTSSRTSRKSFEYLVDFSNGKRMVFFSNWSMETKCGCSLKGMIFICFNLVIVSSLFFFWLVADCICSRCCCSPKSRQTSHWPTTTQIWIHHRLRSSPLTLLDRCWCLQMFSFVRFVGDFHQLRDIGEIQRTASEFNQNFVVTFSNELLVNVIAI